MKFGKRLKHQIEQSLPEWRDKFLSYNDLKKVVKLISSAPKIRSRSDEEFMHLLNNEIDKLNAFFMEQEEDFVIRHKELAQKIQNVKDKWGPNGTEQPSEEKFKEEMAKIRKQIVNFHGEMVLLVNYSNVNYTGLAKILKKYDKWTGGALRLPVIQKVVDQPFFTTDLISILVKECEMTMDSVFPPPEGATNGGAAGAAAAEGIFRNTVAALLTMEEMRRSSSTHSHFSLPPLDLAGFDVIQSLRAHSPIPIP